MESTITKNLAGNGWKWAGLNAKGWLENRGHVSSKSQLVERQERWGYFSLDGHSRFWNDVRVRFSPYVHRSFFFKCSDCYLFLSLTPLANHNLGHWKRTFCKTPSGVKMFISAVFSVYRSIMTTIRLMTSFSEGYFIKVELRNSG